MSSQLDFLTARLQQVEQDNAQIRAQFQQAQRRLRAQAGLALSAFVAGVFLLPANRQAIAQGYGVTLATLNTRLIAVENRATTLEAKTQFQSADGVARSTTFSGCNVMVNDGGGSTTALVKNAAGEGLGNLIVGYNAFGNSNGGDNRTGSHNLIVGDQNSYSSYGGLVAGKDNQIASAYASVSGGYANISNNFASSVSGGYGNSAMGPYVFVGGGYGNSASNFASAVSGGSFNVASGGMASISGGYGNIAPGQYGSVSGGFTNNARNFGSSVSGGANNTADGQFTSVSGGYGNTARFYSSSVSGGTSVLQNDEYGWSAGSLHSP